MKFTKKYKNYLVTFSVEFLILFLGFIIFRIANEKMTEFGFSEYALSRRNISFLQPLLMVGLGVAVPRYSGIFLQKNSFLPTGLFLISVVSLIFMIILQIGNKYFAYLFFGDIYHSSFIFPLSLLLIGYGFHAILYGFLRGKQEIYFSNLIQLINIGVLPVFILLYTHDVKKLLYINSIILLFNNCIFSLIIFKKRMIKLNIKECKEDAILLLKYGLPRVIGDFALLALLTCPTYIVLLIQKNILLGGDIAYSLTLFNLLGAAFVPLSLVLLPEISIFLSEKKYDLIKKRFSILIIFSLTITTIAYLGFYFFSDFILNISLGSKYRHEIVEFSSIILLGSCGYVLYIVLRSFLDAIHVKASNAFNLLIVLFVYLILVYIGYSLNVNIKYYLYYFVISINLLGLLTFIKTYYTLKNIK